MTRPFCYPFAMLLRQFHLPAAIRGYLALKWVLPLGAETPVGIRDALCVLGMKSDPLFSSIIIAR